MCPPKKLKPYIVLQRGILSPFNSSPKPTISPWNPKGDPMRVLQLGASIYLYILEDDQYGSNILESSAYVMIYLFIYFWGGEEWPCYYALRLEMKWQHHLKWGGNFLIFKSLDLYMWFALCNQIYRKMINDLYFILKKNCSHIWLNLPKGGRLFFFSYIFQLNDCNFSYKQKFLEQNPKIHLPRWCTIKKKRTTKTTTTTSCL
jgi:hypothetical protein